jgi:NTP pyrophosphatase (non-canonical NTP hydrolase)
MKKDLLKIINHYGVNNQLMKLTEETLELQEAIIEYENKIGEKEHITEEVADVLNVVEQFIYYYEIDFNKVIEIKHNKVHRQLERMKEE